MSGMVRSLINLAKVRAGEMLLDPFAGTCGILIEPGLISIKGTGMQPSW
jgi:tRNA (guanine10-N2)-dimethyltransferase